MSAEVFDIYLSRYGGMEDSVKVVLNRVRIQVISHFKFSKNLNDFCFAM